MAMIVYFDKAVRATMSMEMCKNLISAGVGPFQRRIQCILGRITEIIENRTVKDPIFEENPTFSI